MVVRAYLLYMWRKGDGEKGHSGQYVYLLNPSSLEYNFAKVKDDAIAFTSILFGERVCIV
jgi:hypothetical protein